MRTLITCAVLWVIIASIQTHALGDTFGAGPNALSIDFVFVDDYAGGTTGGRFAYRIGKYEIGREMIDKANALGGLGLTLNPMDFVTGPLGDGPRAAMPATGISWNEAARFVNWLNITTGNPAAYRFLTQPGDPDYDANENVKAWHDYGNQLRNSAAKYFLPNIWEWHRAAYADPATGGYWEYPNGSNSVPVPTASGTSQKSAVWDQPISQGPADITQAGGLSPYGTMGQGGNAWEWIEPQSALDIYPPFRVPLKGGSWIDSVPNHSYLRGGDYFSQARPTNDVFAPPDFEHRFIGFRVASIPEPSGGLLGALGVWALFLGKRATRCRQIQGNNGS